MANKILLTKKQKIRLSKWYNELRTTNKEQGQGALRNTINGTDKFCCLGIYGMWRKPNNWDYDTNYECWELTVGRCTSNIELPFFLSKELGINNRLKIKNTDGNTSPTPLCSRDNNIVILDVETIFIFLNDFCLGWTFERIADAVEYYEKTGQIMEEALHDLGIEVIEYAPK